MQKPLERLRALKDELENTSFLNWDEVDIWGKKALPTLAKNWSEYLDEFKSLLKKPVYPGGARFSVRRPDLDDPRYIFSPENYQKDQRKWLESERRNKQQRESEAAGYRQNCENAYRKILAFLDGIIHEAENSVTVTATVTHTSDHINPQRVDELIETPALEENEIEVNVSRVERSIEFPPEYCEAGTSILSYFNRVLNVKYPSRKIKVRIEQEGLMLRMVIETLTGEREEIEKALEEYGMVVTGKMKSESFLADPFEAMALKNKLEIADLELRQTRKLLDFTRDNSQQRIDSLEVQVNKLHSIIEKGLQSGDHVFRVIRKMSKQDRSTYNLSNAKFGGGFATEGGFQVGGNLIDLSSASNLTDAAQQIQELLQQLQEQGVPVEDAKQQAANDLAKQAEANPIVMGKLVKWGQSLADTASKTTVSEAARGVFKLALQMSGISLL